jgi:hypothetical protein
MYKIDILLNQLHDSMTSLKKARAAADDAKMPSDELDKLDTMIATLDATIDRTQKIGMSRGLEEPIKVPKKFELDLSRTREQNTED